MNDLSVFGQIEITPQIDDVHVRSPVESYTGTKFATHNNNDNE